MSNLRNTVLIGAHHCLWTLDGGTEMSLGFTAEGVEIQIETSETERTVHELAAPFDMRADSVNITTEIILKEVDPDRLAAALNALKTVVAGPPAKTAVDVSPERGRQMAFGKLVFRPRTLTGVGGTDKSKDKTIWNAIVLGNSTRIFRANEDATVTFAVRAGAFWDSVASKWKLYTEGDPDAYGGFTI